MNVNTNKLQIKEEDFDINLVFYNFLKKITQAKFTNTHMKKILDICSSNKNIDSVALKEKLYSYVDNSIKRKNLSLINAVIDGIKDEAIDVFVFALQLFLIKGFLLKESKAIQTTKEKELEELDPLSLAYDDISSQSAYITRVSGALYSLLFFEKIEIGDVSFIPDDKKEYLEDFSKEYKSFLSKGLEPNQIFMILFSEAVNQSIVSDAGASYEKRIKNMLIFIGVPDGNIKKMHDENDASTEFDFFFEHKKRTYGVGAKRTLRERYKQFIKTSHMSNLDVMIQITLGTDLRENIAKAIRKHGVYLFIANEVYDNNRILRDIEGVYPARKLTLNFLEGLK